ncbi:MAG: FGGY family carbohydrate kinase, partial [Microcystaceae cyanobacterium]
QFMAFLGIDFGTSGARGTIINPKQEILWETSLSFSPGAEPNLPLLWQETLWELLAAIPVDVKSFLKAIAINGTSATVLLCDQEGNPLTSPLLYNDNRGKEIQEELQQLTPPNHLAGSSSSSLAKLLWWSKQPYFVQARYLLHQADWLAF